MLSFPYANVRGHLARLQDHDLVAVRRGLDNRGDTYYVPFSDTLVRGWVGLHVVRCKRGADGLVELQIARMLDLLVRWKDA